MSRWFSVRSTPSPSNRQTVTLYKMWPFGHVTMWSFGCFSWSAFIIRNIEGKTRLTHCVTVSVGLPFVLVPKVRWDFVGGGKEADGNKYIGALLWLVSFQLDWR